MFDHKKISWVLWLLLAVIFAYYGFNNSNYFAVASGLGFFALGLSSLSDATNNNSQI